MKKAGFGRINFGLERLTTYSLKMINKEQPLENVHQVLALVSKHGIDPSVFMMAGFPFETKELLEQEKELFLGITKYTHRLFLSVLAPAPGTIYYDEHPELKEWYLNNEEWLMFRAHFTNVLDMHTLHTVKRNYFKLPPEVLAAETEYYHTFKKISYGSVFKRKSLLLSTAMQLDFLAAKVSQLLFAVSPELEFAVFRRIKAVRYYLGNYLFSGNILDS
jgi:radical SAM superfamily enzyme YgiQ (UPF0313 family)